MVVIVGLCFLLLLLLLLLREEEGGRGSRWLLGRHRLALAAAGVGACVNC